MRQNMSSVRWKWFCGGFLVLALACFQSIAASAQAAPATNLGQRVAASVQELQASVQGLTPETWKASKAEKQELTAAQASLQRNLSEAVPGLLQTWNRAPQNLAEAFRLYRDLDVVYQVTSRLEASAGQSAPPDQARAISASTGQLRQSLQQLGDYIQATAALQYTQMQQARAAARPAPAPAPKSVIINDANAAPAHHTTHRRKVVHKKKTQPKPATPPSSPQGGPPAGMD